MDFLQDLEFLQKVNRHKVKEYWAAIMVLDFQTEKPLARIEGKVVSGNITVAAKSTTRRVGSLNLVFDSTTKNITNVNNLIAIDKKVQISVGITNPYYQSSLDEYKRYLMDADIFAQENDFGSFQSMQLLQEGTIQKYLAEQGHTADEVLVIMNTYRTLKNEIARAEKYVNYGDILWYNQGVFVITKANSTVNAQSSSVAISFVDKMAFLNGTCGGVLPSTVSFHDLTIIDEYGNTSTDYPLISTIIRECVQHYGGEHPSRIIISDLEDVGRQVVRYQGSTPIHFYDGPDNDGALSSPRGNYVIADSAPEGFGKTFYKGEIVGYLETPLTYPGELIMGIGSTVTKVLDEIVNALGNYEYFYDVDGNFHFQKIRNYMYTGNVPLNYNQFSVVGISSDPTKPTYTVENDDSIQKLYLPVFQADAFLNEFADTELVTQIGFTPNYENIKNDFIVWGTRDSNEENAKKVRYHLAIDKRPVEEFDAQGNSTSLCNQHIYAIVLPYKKDYANGEAQEDTDDRNEQRIESEIDGQIIRYSLSPSFSDPNNLGYEVRHVCRPLKESFPNLSHEYHYNWREELYRMALLNYGSSTDVEQSTNGAVKMIGEQYFEELRAEWRAIFNPESTSTNYGPKSFQTGWEDYFGTDSKNPWFGYKVDVATNPRGICYWLDLLDVNSTIGQFSVDRIGRRTVAKENNKVNEVFANEVNDIVFIDTSNQDWRYKEQLNGEGLKGRLDYYVKIGQPYCLIPSSQIALFQKTNSYGTCFDDIRDLLYRNLIYQSAVTLTSIPMFYLDVNKILRLNFPDKGITGDYVINQISWSLGATATMNLQLQEAMVIN